MTEPALNNVSGPDEAAGHRMAYWQWGQPDASHVVVRAYGRSRQRGDFDVLAQALRERVTAQPDGIRVACPGVAGRGESGRLKEPMGCQMSTYATDLLTLLVHLHAHSTITTLGWLGASMGGLIGTAPCGQPGLPFKKVSESFAQPGEVMLWQLDDAIKGGTHLLRRGPSDLLSPERRTP